MARKKQQELIWGHAAHRRTEGDYMGVLLETVTLDDWRAMPRRVHGAGAVPLMGKPAGSAPTPLTTPLTVVVQQLNGADPLIDKLAREAIHSAKFPDSERGWKDGVKAGWPPNWPKRCATWKPSKTKQRRGLTAIGGGITRRGLFNLPDDFGKF